MEKLSFNELKIEKVKFRKSKILRVQPKRFNVFNAGVCLASCLTYRPFLTQTLSDLVAYKKTEYFFSRKKLVLINLNAIFSFKICCNFHL